MRKTIAALALAGAAVTAGAGAANAIVTDGYSSIRQVVCSETGAYVDLAWSNQYGNTERRESTWLSGDSQGGITCITFDSVAGEYGEFVGTSITDESGGRVYCAIWVDGRLVSENRDNSAGYSYATCM